jgi:hypothetical protein
MGLFQQPGSVPNQKFAKNSTGPRDRPSPAWGLVENRPALFPRRRPSGARRAVKASLAHGSVQGGHGVHDPLQVKDATGTPPAGRVPTGRVGVAQRARGDPEGLYLSANL